MNHGTEVQTAQQTTLEGPLSLSMTLLIAATLMAVFAWSLYRERIVLGTRTTVGFLVLRMICLATVLWMLLAPTRVLVETSTTKRVIAIVADTSASMHTIDPPGSSDEVRWVNESNRVSPMSDEEADPTTLADRAFASLGVADRELAASIEAVSQHRADQQIADSIAATQKAIARSQANVEQLRQRPLGTMLGGERAAVIEPVLRNAWRLLTGPEFQDFQALSKRLSAGRSPRQADWRESLRDLQYRLKSSHGVLSELSRLIADAQSQRLPPSEPSTRLGRVAAFLETLKATTLDPMGESADVSWAQFSKTSAPLTNVQSPKARLLNQRNTTPKMPQSNAAQAATNRDDANRDDANRNEAERDSPETLATNLSAALEPLRSAEGEIPLSAAFVFTDVAHNDTGMIGNLSDESTEMKAVRDPTDVAATLSDTPVYIVPIGNSNRLRDVNLVGVDAPTVAMRNDDIVIEAHLEAYQCDGDRCTVKLLDGAEVVDFREIQVDSDFASRTIRFQRRVSEIGPANLSVVIDGVDGEMTQTNNLRKIGINVTRNQIKVLLADEMPRWEFRYLAQLFRRDPKVQCDEMLFRPRLIATGDRESSGMFPTTADDWDQYDVVILGDLPPEHLPVAAQESLSEYLSRRGGTLVLMAGSRAMPDAFASSPLGELLPVTKTEERLVAPDGFAFQATRDGRTHVALMIGETQAATQTAWDFVNRFSPLHEVSPWRRPKPSAKNLIAVVPRGEPVAEEELTDSFLCWQPIGRGRVVYFSGPETYRLRFLRGDRYHYRFWGQLLRWAIASDMLSGSKLVRLRTDRTDYKTGQDVGVEVRLSQEDGTPVTDEAVRLKVTSGETEQQVSLIPDAESPGLYRGQISSPRPGVYAVEPVGGYIDTLPTSETVKELGLSFTVQADLPRELADTRSNRVLAAQISQLTGGQVLPPSAVAEVLALTDLSPVVTETVQQTPLWSQWKYLWLVFGCLQTEWMIRKWRGLS